jgi:hypothetical protein
LFKAIRYEKQILIVLLWSVMIFIGYNILTVEAKESNDKKVCESYNGEWKNIGGGDRGCTFDNVDEAERYGYRPGFSLDSTGSDAEYGIEDLVSYDNEGNKVYPPNPFDKTDSSKQQQEERAKMTQSKSFEKFVESKGIDIDDDYHWLSAQEQEEIETEFKEDKSDEYAEEINKDNKEDEGKRYVNPDGGAPLYEDELTEDEKDDYTEYKPEKDEKQQEEESEGWEEKGYVDLKASPQFELSEEDEKEIEEVEEEQAKLDDDGPTEPQEESEEYDEQSSQEESDESEDSEEEN